MGLQRTPPQKAQPLPAIPSDQAQAQAGQASSSTPAATTTPSGARGTTPARSSSAQPETRTPAAAQDYYVPSIYPQIQDERPVAPTPSRTTQRDEEQVPVEGPAQGEEGQVEGGAEAEGDADRTRLSAITPTRAFMNRPPGVIRSPPLGQATSAGLAQSTSRQEHMDERPIRPAPPAAASVSSPTPTAAVIPIELRESRGETPMEVDLRSRQESGQTHTQAEAGSEAEIKAQNDDQMEVDAVLELASGPGLRPGMTLDDSMEKDESSGDASAPGWDVIQGNSTVIQDPFASNPEAGPSTRRDEHPRASSQNRDLSHETSEVQPQTQTAPQSQPPYNPQALIPTTPGGQDSAPKTPRSRYRSRRPTEPLESPPTILPGLSDGPDYGRRYQLTLETLDRAVKAGAQRWTADQLRECLPQITKNISKSTENFCLSASQSMRDRIMSDATKRLEDYKVGEALQSIDAIDAEAREYKRIHSSLNESDAGEKGEGEGEGEGSKKKRPRADAWRPDITPQALVAATVLPIYDDAYAKLREEYLELHQYCTERYIAIRDKQAALKEIESGVAGGVVDLQKTIEILDKLPMEDMMLWTETAETKLDTRAPEHMV